MAEYQPAQHLTEDERIQLIGTHVMTKKPDGKNSAFIVDNEPDKIARYIKKLTERFPEIEIVRQFAGPTPGVYTVMIRKKGS